MLSRVEVHGASCPTMKSDTMIVDTLLLTVKKLMLKILIGRREEIKLSYKVFAFRGDSKMDDNPALLSSDVISRSRSLILRKIASAIQMETITLEVKLLKGNLIPRMECNAAGHLIRLSM